MNYLIKYTIKDKPGAIIKSGTIVVKNKYTELHAKMSLNSYLMNKHPAMSELIIHSCEVENDIPQFFKDIFK